MAGGSGKITVAEDFAVPDVHLTGLVPGTEYYVRVTAHNEKGTTNEFEGREKVVAKVPYLTFTTLPAYPEVSVDELEEIGVNSVTVLGSIRPDEAETRWHFEYSTSPGGPWVMGPGGVIPASEADAEFHPAKGVLTGLKEATTYYVRLFAENGNLPNQTSGARSFETAGPPSASTFEVHTLDGESLRALGSVRPDGVDTHYHAEYVSQEGFEASGFAGAVSTQAADAGVGALMPMGAITRMWSLVWIFPGLVAGKTYRYRLVAHSASGVSDGDEQSLTVPVPGPSAAPSCPNEASRTGASGALPDCRAYEQVTPAEKGGAQDIFKYGANAEGVRVGEDGEHFLMHAPGVQWGPSPDSSASNYLFSRTTQGWQMTSLTPGAAGPDSYRPDLLSADLGEAALEVGWATDFASSSPNLEFEVGPAGGPYATAASVPRAFHTEWVAASADQGKVVLRSEDHALLGSPTGTISGYDLYEFSEGRLRQVNVLTGGGEISTCGASMVNGHETPVQSSAISSAHAVSAEGRVYSSPTTARIHLYMRVNGAETVDIGEYTFLFANAEGSELLLQKDSGGTFEALLYDTETGAFKPLFSVGGDLQEARMQVSEDMSTIYFDSAQKLRAEAPTGIQSLYRYDLSTGALSFVAAGPGANFVSPNGRYVYFGGGTGETNFPGIPGGVEHIAQVFRYDSLEKVVQCISCASPFDPEPKLSATWEGLGNAPGANGVPGPTVASANGDYVFFDTPAALVPQDIDGEIKPGIRTESRSPHGKAPN